MLTTVDLLPRCTGVPAPGGCNKGRALRKGRVGGQREELEERLLQGDPLEQAAGIQVMAGPEGLVAHGGAKGGDLLVGDPADELRRDLPAVGHLRVVVAPLPDLGP